MNVKSESRKDQLPIRALWMELAWTLPVSLVAFVVFSRPSEDGASNFWVGMSVGFFLIAKTILEHFWPRLKSGLLAFGTPSWAVEKGFRSNAMITAILAIALTVISVWEGSHSGWIQQFAVIYGALLCLFTIADAISKRVGLH